MRMALISLVLLTVASVAPAALYCDVVKNASPGPGLESYTVWFKGTAAGDELAAFSGSIKGPLNQVWGLFGSYSPTVYDPSTSDSWPGFIPAYRDKDTRLLLASGDLTTVLDPPGEDAAGLVPLPGGAHEEGVGTYFANTADTDMTFGILPASRSLNLAFAQVVLATGAEARLTAEAAAGDEVQLLELDNIIIPEPATLGLLVVGAAAALIRRRRR